MRLKDRTAIITGAAQGLGLAFATRFLAEGANVVLADLNSHKLDEARHRLDPERERTRSITVDVAQESQVTAMADAAIEAFGRIDILVNNAGGAGAGLANDIEEVSEATWD
jgi:NAD(P)-dependent dehydrogenase (short-subunit alcohol dehydrogenase family)